jgi:hypothetical protein
VLLFLPFEQNTITPVITGAFYWSLGSRTSRLMLMFKLKSGANLDIFTFSTKFFSLFFSKKPHF